LLGNGGIRDTQFEGVYVHHVGRTGQILTITNPENPMVIMNVHAPHPGRGQSRGNAQADSHLACMAGWFRALQMTLPTDATLIVGGDFNATFDHTDQEGRTVLHPMSFQGIEKSLKSSTPCPTYPDSNDSPARDFILTSGTFVSGTQQLRGTDRLASDHLAVKKTVRLSPLTGAAGSSGGPVHGGFELNNKQIQFNIERFCRFQ
jgi:endonuclease/exonuclease/phosphatase family metal-dependent hydrolase